jgi:hypothetical protein
MGFGKGCFFMNPIPTMRPKKPVEIDADQLLI